ncbi:hypothetical protein CBL_02759 [Carabus blaptoides fortunei]
MVCWCKVTPYQCCQSSKSVNYGVGSAGLNNCDTTGNQRVILQRIDSDHRNLLCSFITRLKRRIFLHRQCIIIVTPWGVDDSASDRLASKEGAVVGTRCTSDLSAYACQTACVKIGWQATRSTGY